MSDTEIRELALRTASKYWDGTLRMEVYIEAAIREAIQATKDKK